MYVFPFAYIRIPCSNSVRLKAKWFIPVTFLLILCWISMKFIMCLTAMSSSSKLTIFMYNNFQERQFGTTPLVKCGAKNFSKVKEFMMRFPTIPDVSEFLAYVISWLCSYLVSKIVLDLFLVLETHRTVRYGYPQRTLMPVIISRPYFIYMFCCEHFNILYLFKLLVLRMHLCRYLSICRYWSWITSRCLAMSISVGTSCWKEPLL